jgi:hypothetical protein
METSHDQPNEIAAGPEPDAGDLEVPEAVAEETVGGNIIQRIPGRLKWQNSQLKIGMTAHN